MADHARNGMDNVFAVFLLGILVASVVLCLCGCVGSCCVGHDALRHRVHPMPTAAAPVEPAVKDPKTGGTDLVVDVEPELSGTMAIGLHDDKLVVIVQP